MDLFFYLAVFVGVVFAPCSHGQGLVKETTNGSTALQPWLVGLTAVAVFLFVMFVANLINRIFFFQKKDDKDEMENIEIEGRKDDKDEMENIEIEGSVEENVYENKAMEPDEESLQTKI